MKQCWNERAIKNRLNKIEGQLRGIKRMVEKGQGCDEILIQIGSAKAALQKTGQFILEGYLQNCVTEGIRKGKGEATVRKLASAIEQFSRIV